MSELASIPKIVVTGATSIVGRLLLPRMVEDGYEVHAVSRASGTSLPTMREQPVWHQADISQSAQIPGINAGALVHLAPLWLLPPLLPVLNSLGIKRVIGFGSTSLFSKANSADETERRVAARLAEAEEAISRFCCSNEMDWTIFRPTLVYDCARDKNITRIANFIQRYRFFPLIGKAAGLRQPVHAADLAEACMLALWNPSTFGKAYNLSGGETLSYRHMVEKIFNSLGKPVRFLLVPAWFYRLAIRSAVWVAGKRSITPEMATRMNTDLSFDHSEATRDFGFSPRSFSPDWGAGAADEDNIWRVPEK